MQQGTGTFLRVRIGGIWNRPEMKNRDGAFDAFSGPAVSTAAEGALPEFEQRELLLRIEIGPLKSGAAALAGEAAADQKAERFFALAARIGLACEQTEFVGERFRRAFRLGFGGGP